MASSNLQSKTQSVPTDDQWRDLYAAANSFKSAVCWQWMENGDIFVVQDPLSRQKFFCAIMGNAGMEFGLVAYRGYGGFKLLHRLLTVEDESDEDALSEDIMFLQDSLSCTFDDREALEKKDLEVIRRLGLKYRGRGEWPCFRDYTPGMVPWFLTGSQCVTLTHVLEQALVVAMECKKAGNNDILFGPQDELMLRFARKTPDGLKWAARFMEDTEEREESLEITLTDQVLVRKLKNLPMQKRKSWELDRFCLPTPIHDRARPYFPQMVAIADHETGMALNADMVETNDPPQLAADQLIEVLLSSGVKPRRILVKQDKLAILLGTFCEQIGIELRLLKVLPRISELRQGLLEFSRR